MTEIIKKHLPTKTNREVCVALLPERYKREVKRILKVSDLVELNLKQIEEKIKEAPKKIRVTFKRSYPCPGSI
ncbi:hypothetical protein KHM19_20720 [Leptospira borgpetersenii]|nr:hypothetical protein KHM09_20400 [Leptospira borgpetersenii]GIM22889.1 hypothetical protein KHM19_20720 [Leptospira borgpetersenii]GIM26196.1 hypothetical protein KHM25_21210 [Leptospira borgpetersenii]